MIFKQPALEIPQNTQLKPLSIAWLFPHADLSRDPSNRLRRFQLHRYFQSLYSVESSTFTLYDKISDLRSQLLYFDVVVLFNVTEFDRDLCRYLRGQGKTVIFDHCENIFGLGAEDEIMHTVSAITCCSTALANNTEGYLSRYNFNQNLFVIRDPLDGEIEKKSIKPLPGPFGSTNLALIMGMGANVQYVIPLLEEACIKSGYRVRILTEAGFDFPNHEVRVWSPYSWTYDAMECDVALCCHDKGMFAAKGNVKVTNPMALGLPVIATSIESYTEAITDGYNGLIVESPDLWPTCLDKLKDQGLRNIMGLRARQTAFNNYGTDKIALDYLSMIALLRVSADA